MLVEDSGAGGFRLIADSRGVLRGRGAYCHLSRECLQHKRLEEALVAAVTRAGSKKARKAKNPASKKGAASRTVKVLRDGARSALERGLAAEVDAPASERLARALKEFDSRPDSERGKGFQTTKRKIRF